MRGGIKSINTPVYDISLYELLKTYATINTQKAFKTINIPKLPVLTADIAIKHIKNNLDELNDWKEIVKLIPNELLINKKMNRTGIAGIFAASLELTKEGLISIMQKKLYDTIFIKRKD
jgi:segregation and condensation protein A